MSVSKRLNTLLDKLYSLHPKLIDLSLTRVLRFLDTLGNPHLNLPPVIHVAGTNGKGSTIAMMRSILEAHSKTVHVATSPHLVRINERIVLAGQEIDDETLIDLIEECMEKNKGEDITFFEMIIAVTFLAFSRVDADFCLIETGLGGRLDATNVIPDPVCTVITSISKDHQEFLGETLPQITAEKAGIMKKGVPCIIGQQNEDAIAAGVIDTFQSQALSTGAVLHQYGTDWRCDPIDAQMRFKAGSVEYTLQQPSLLGSHQIANAGAAIEALRVIPGLTLDPEKISTGLGQIKWPARLQHLPIHTFDGINLEGFDIWLDGGHNESAGEVIGQQIKNWIKDGSKDVHVILGMMTRKNPAAFAQNFAKDVRSLSVVPIPGENGGYSPEGLVSEIKTSFEGPITPYECVEDALKALQNEYDHGIILICGSLYLAGHVLSAIKTP